MKATMLLVLSLFLSFCLALPSIPPTFHARVGAKLTSGANVWSGAGMFAVDLPKGFARTDLAMLGSSLVNFHTLDRYDVEQSYVIDNKNNKCQTKQVTGTLIHPLAWFTNATFSGESDYNGEKLENWEYKEGKTYQKVAMKKGTNVPVMFVTRGNVGMNNSESELVMTVRDWDTKLSPQWARYIPAQCVNANNLGDVNGIVYFANNNWNCADPACDSTVPTGSPQPDYGCAEFVARSLAYGSFIPGLGAYDSQSSFYNYNCQGTTESLINTESLSDCLGTLGWTKLAADYSSVAAGVATFGDGGDGWFSHAVIGVGPQTIDAHNWAFYQINIANDLINGVDAAWGPPGSVPSSSTSSTGSYYSTQAEANIFVEGGGKNEGGKIQMEKNEATNEISFIEEAPAQKF